MSFGNFGEFSTVESKALGNPRFNAPEITQSKEITPKSDVYNFGLVMK
jgi:serine/threonine protein kinase